MTNFENELAKCLQYYIGKGPLSEEQCVVISKKITKNLIPYLKEENNKEEDEITTSIAIVNISQQISESDFEVSQRIKRFKDNDTIKDIKNWYEDLNKEYLFFKGQLKLIFE